MQNSLLPGNIRLILLVVLAAAVTVQSSDRPRERIDYWQSNYEELLPKEDSLAARAHTIFSRVLNAAGSRPGVVPRLFLLKRDPLGIPLAVSIPDGGIILSRGALEICYRDERWGDDRLAFILAHEIAHQLKDDFWHLKFFQAVESSRGENAGTNRILDEIRSIADLTDQVLAKELQADEHGIVYASMAGFNTHAIVSEKSGDDFFEIWVRSVDPTNISGIRKDHTHPSPKQRAEAVKARLKQILEKVDVFNIGLFFYQAEDYRHAALAFNEFLRFFPSREVYHNLASCHHQLALEYHRHGMKGETKIPFKLSIAVDPITLAERIRTPKKKSADPARSYSPSPSLEHLFYEEIETAIELYENAKSLDPSFILTYNNLGCALIEKGEIYKAIGIFKDALKIDSTSAEVLNNLGVAFHFVNNPAGAQECFLKAHEQNPTYGDPLINLGKIAYEQQDEAEAKKHWMKYLAMGLSDSWSDAIRNELGLREQKTDRIKAIFGMEKILDLEAGYYEDEIPINWGEPVSVKWVALEEEPYKLSVFQNNVTTLSLEGEIIFIVTLDGFSGKSTGGVEIGSSQEDLLFGYGPPSRILKMSGGDCWVYDSRGMTFILRDGSITYWLLYM